jgi:hypothetical protein
VCQDCGLFVPNERQCWAFSHRPSLLGVLAIELAGGCEGTLLYFRAVHSVSASLGSTPVCGRDGTIGGKEPKGTGHGYRRRT